MIHFIRGALAAKLEGRIVVETGGIGYEIHVAGNSAVWLKQEGDQVLVYTTMMVREDDVSLYGFADRESLTLFHRLLTVGGVGAKAAMALLSAMPPADLTKAIVFGDAAMLTRANGIGKKSAERIILELKDKLDLASAPGAGAGPVSLSEDPGDSRTQAVEALMGLGYSRAEAATAVQSCREESLTVEEYIKKALKRI